jgi:hypothetical protein
MGVTHPADVVRPLVLGPLVDWRGFPGSLFLREVAAANVGEVAAADVGEVAAADV